MDESFRSILPYLRPQNQPLPPWVDELFFLLAAVLLPAWAIFTLLRRHRWHRHARDTFIDHAVERGLSAEQGRLLLGIARRHRMKHPLLLLSSLKSFDLHLGRYLSGQAHHNGEVVAALREIRRVLGFDRPPPQQPLPTTRELALGQTLMVWPEKGGAEGFCPCAVVQQDERAISLVPLLRKDEEHFRALAPGERVKVRFWDLSQVEYRFRTEVLPSDPESTFFAVRHAEELERLQKRDFFRLPVDFELALSPDDEPDSSIAGRAVDLSGGGLGILTQAEVEPEAFLVIDPSFKGDFPLAGLRCQVLKQLPQPSGYRLNLEFLDLSPQQEGEIIRRIYQQQLHRA